MKDSDHSITTTEKPSPFTFTIDWEDFGQLYCKYIDGKIVAPLPKDIERQTDIILQLLDDNQVTATFFILGILAKYRPDLVEKISDQGHEIALHGMNHEFMYKLAPTAAKADLSDSKNLICDITGKDILGYRAPFFSIVKNNLYLLETLSELGFEYDSSIFPIKMSRYGIDGFSNVDTLYKLGNNKNIVELPLTVFSYAGKMWPVSGGGYIRLLPQIIIERIYKSLNDKEENCMFYMHPYEFDSEGLNVSSNLSNATKIIRPKIHYLNFRWNLFRKKIPKKVEYILKNYTFSTCIEKSNYVKQNSYSPTILG